MDNFWEIVGFEYRKLFGRKMVPSVLALGVLFIVTACCGSLFGDVFLNGTYYDSNYNLIKKDIENAKALSGRNLDDELIGEMRDAYEKADPSDMITYMTYARPYIQIYRIVSNISADEVTNAQQYYAEREKRLESLWEKESLTEGEKEWLRVKESELEKPFVFEYSSGWFRSSDMGYTVGLVMVFLIGICVPLIFTQEHMNRTAQVNFCARHGKGKLYRAKVFVAVSFSMAVNLVMVIVALAATLLIYGTDGFGAGIQLVLPLCSLPLTMGQGALITLGLSFFASLFYSVFVMLLAECFKNNIIPLGILIGVFLTCNAVSVPDNMRFLSQLYNCLPHQLPQFNAMASNKLFYLFGNYFTRQQVVPFLYLAVCVVLLIVCRKVYLRYQVGKTIG
ncbi:MAG: hypothetical protein NC086_05200 [Alistipes sp.]|nr:hypothetical protein [Alistipes sp.]